MEFDNIKKAKIILVLNFFAISFFIVTTPLLIDSGTEFASEDTMEAVFLFLELLALVFIFRHYDNQIKESEKEASLTTYKLKRKEKELLDSLEHLGKVNVQISFIKELFEKTKVPSTRSQLHEIYAELLRLVCNSLKKEGAYLRIINLKNNKTFFEHSEDLRRSSEKENLFLDKIKVGNKKLTEFFYDYRREFEVNDGMVKVFCSGAENFYIKAFIMVPDPERDRVLTTQEGLIQAIASQCEIIFLLFNSRYYKAD